MPAGSLISGPAVLEGPIAFDLEAASIPVPSSGSWSFAALPFLAGSLETLADPHPIGFPGAARKLPLFDSLFFDRIHVIPRRKDFGAVITDQEIEVEVWNAFLAESRKLTAIVVEGPEGIEVDNPLPLPTIFPATESKLYTVRALAEGDPTIDNLVTWTFEGVPISGTNIVLVGFRLNPWPFEPNMVEAIEESFGYLTDILVARSGSEQRIQLRAIPIGSLAFSVLLEDREYQLAQALLYQQARAFGVPLWQFRTKLLALAAADQNEILIDTSFLPFQAGGLVFLWIDSFTWEAQRIAEVQADRLILDLDLRSSWPAGSWAMPLVIGRLSEDEAFTHESLRAGSARIAFSVEGFTP